MAATRLRTEAPFDGHGVMRYFADHAVHGVESGDNSSYRRKVRRENGTAVELSVTLGSAQEVCATEDGDELSPRSAEAVRRLFDLDANSRAIDAHLSADPALAESVARHPGVRIPGSLDWREQLVRTMIGQQISIAAARTVTARIVRELGDEGMFPTATVLAERGLDVLRGPVTRIAAIHGAALAMANGTLDVSDERDAEAFIASLCRMPGIGAWTAGYVAMRVLGAQDVLLANDVVLLKGATKVGLPGTPRELAVRAERWHPYRSYATLHLWRIAQSASDHR